jgi:hypothetical protein
MGLYQNLSLYNFTATSIYKTKDDRFYHIHGSLRAQITQEAIGAPIREPKAKFIKRLFLNSRLKI